MRPAYPILHILLIAAMAVVAIAAAVASPDYVAQTPLVVVHAGL